MPKMKGTGKRPPNRGTRFQQAHQQGTALKGEKGIKGPTPPPAMTMPPVPPTKKG